MSTFLTLTWSALLLFPSALTDPLRTWLIIWTMDDCHMFQQELLDWNIYWSYGLFFPFSFWHSNILFLFVCLLWFFLFCFVLFLYFISLVSFVGWQILLLPLFSSYVSFLLLVAYSLIYYFCLKSPIIDASVAACVDREGGRERKFNYSYIPFFRGLRRENFPHLFIFSLYIFWVWGERIWASICFIFY